MVIESLAKQNFVTASEEAINQLVRTYQTAQQTYLAASAYFDKADVTLPVKYIMFFFLVFMIVYNNAFLKPGVYKIFSRTR